MLKEFLLLPLLAMAASAQTENQVVITENSSTSLTATYNGGSLSVVNLIPDRWQIGGLANPGAGYSVFATPEPENAALVNIIAFGDSDSGLPFIDVFSDYELGVTGVEASVIGEQNGVPFQDGVDGNGNPIMVTFNDDAAASETSVPDATSTGGLLMLAALALCGVSRFAVAKS